MSAIHTASRSEYLGHALEAVIRSRVRDRGWYRRHSHEEHGGGLCRLDDLARENELLLRELFRVRREGLALHRAEDARLAAAWHRAQAEWRLLMDAPESADPLTMAKHAESLTWAAR